MKTKTIEISGMTCGHCVMSVKKELMAVDGLSITSVNIGTAVVQVDELKVSDEALTRAVSDAGYAVKSLM